MYPYSGKATIEYTFTGVISTNAVAEIVLSADDMSATFVQSNIVAGVNSHVIDFASSFGGAFLLTNASFVVTISEGAAQSGGVQLWENGPCWATCNVGATTSSEYGYYFWWGDTVGYTNAASAWISVEDGSEIWIDDRGTPAQTYGKDDETLLSEGYIDTNGSLAAAHDAATAHLGAPWRMPTAAEFSALLVYCTTAWGTTASGVSGLLVTGKGDYSDRSIFLPAGGYGPNYRLSDVGTGYFWSSTPRANYAPTVAHYLTVSSSGAEVGAYQRYHLRSVRPVRSVLYGRASGSVTYSPSESQTTPVMVPYEWIGGYPALLAGQSGDYEAAANAVAANGRPVWACYVIGVNPTDPLDDFRITRFWMDGYMPMFEFSHATDGSGNSFLPYVNRLGKARLEDEWRRVPDGGDSAFRFFTVEVVPPGCASLVKKELGGVQLWENGPYWAECNVGATTSEEYGYYFWWGDTVGYTNTGSAWVAVDGSTSNFSFIADNTPTAGKNNATLLSEGYIDSTGNLTAAHDAATAHLGAPWRMPTNAELLALIENCTFEWITTNGVSGTLITGKGDYADRSILIPPSGWGYESDFSLPGQYYGYCWTATPTSDNSNNAYHLYAKSSSIIQKNTGRIIGYPVRPVRDAD